MQRLATRILWGLILCVLGAVYARSSTENPGYRRPLLYYKFGLNPQAVFPIILKYLPIDPIIVEAGAFDGSDSRALAEYWPQGHVHSFEPVKRLFDRLVPQTYGIPNLSVYQLALGDACGQTFIHLAFMPDDPEQVSMSSSLYQPKDHLLYYDTPFRGVEEVRQVSLDDWADEYRIPRIDMLWLDLQGAELLVLKGMPKKLKQVRVILTELEFSELYEGQPLYHEIKEWLDSQGFVLIGGNFSFPKDEKQHFGDGLFVRKTLLRYGG